MTVKTRAELKGENATDFPDNSARLISPADLRGQMDDVADSAILAEDLPGLGVTTVVTTIPDNLYTLTAADNGTLLYFTSDEPITVIVPAGLSATFTCRLVQGGAGQITITPSGTVVHSAASKFTSAEQFTVLSLTAIAQDEYLLSGNLVRREADSEVPVNTALPTIVAVGFKLTATRGIWTNEPSDFFYQWNRNTTPIEAAEEENYNLTDADVGTLITVTVTARNEFADFGEGVATSLSYGPVVGSMPVNVAVPVITGGSSPPKVGQTITASPGIWTGTPTPVFTVQWLNGGAEIDGATQVTYRLDLGDLGDLVSARVTATNAVGMDFATTAAVGPIAAGTDVTAPVLSALSVDANGEQAAFLSVTTSEGDGTLYWVVQADGLAAPTAAQVKAGLAGTGAAATSSGSFYVVGIDTWGPNPAGLSAGTTYDCYAVMYDAAGNASNVVTDQFSTAGATLPVLSSQYVSDFADIFAWVTVSTNNGNGNLHVVIVPASDPAPSAVQIEAGQNSASAAAPSAALVLTTPGTKTWLVRGLTAATAYKAYIVQRIPVGYSNTVSSAFISDVLVRQFAYDGTTTGLTANGGVMTASQADPFGGTNAVRWADIGDWTEGAAAAFVSIGSNFVFPTGLVKFHHTEKWVSGALWERASPAINVTSATSVTSWNVSTGTVGHVANYTGTLPVTFDLGSGWHMWSSSKEMVGPDLDGAWAIYMGVADNSWGVYRDGTHARTLWNARITRAA